MRERDPGLEAAIAAAGSINKLAAKLGIYRQAVSKWATVPLGRVIQVEAVTGVPRESLRPDLYRERKTG